MTQSEIKFRPRLEEQGQLLGDCQAIMADLEFYWKNQEHPEFSQILKGDLFFGRSLGYMRYMLVIQLHILFTDRKGHHSILKLLDVIAGSPKPFSWTHQQLEQVKDWKVRLSDSGKFGELFQVIRSFRDKVAAHLDKDHGQVVMDIIPPVKELLLLGEEILNGVNWWLEEKEFEFNPTILGRMENTVRNLADYKNLQDEHYR